MVGRLTTALVAGILVGLQPACASLVPCEDI